VLDTSYVIKLMKEDRIWDVKNRFILYTTIINLYELIRGDVYVGFESRVVKSDYEKVFYILPLDNESIRIASEIWCDLKKKGKSLDERDLLIGAICIRNKMPLATLNKKHFNRLTEYGLELKDV